MTIGRAAQFALLVAALYFGRPVLVPLGLAAYIAFVLTPASNRLERLGLPRGVAVGAVLAGVLSFVSVLGAVLAIQLADLSSKLHGYSAQLAGKLSWVQSGSWRAVSESSRGLAELVRSVEQQLGETTPNVPAVRVVPGGASTLQRLEESLGPLVQPLALAALVLVLAMFMLAQREDLRARLIVLLGAQNVTVTTRTMTEAFARVSHLLLAQVCLNGAFGALIALGLYCIGVPYAALWGAIAGILRFVPLLGAWVATALPTLLALVTFPGWQEAVMTVGLFLVADLALVNFIEPIVLSKRTGVSALALLIAALFWTWLWGVLGLVLAMPITVCAAAIGRHVPSLEFLATALGDQPGLDPALNFYQRTLARASREAMRLARRQAAETSVVATFDQLLVPALQLMAADQAARAITPEASARVVADLAGIGSRLAPRKAGDVADVDIVGVAAESDADALLLRLLDGLLAERGSGLRSIAPGLRDDVLSRTLERRPAVVCIATLPPAGNSNARYFCRQIRKRSPETLIIALVPHAQPLANEVDARLREAGADHVASSLTEALSFVSSQKLLEVAA